MSRERLRVREIPNEEGNRLFGDCARGSGSVVTRPAQMVLLSAQGMERRPDLQGGVHQCGLSAGRDQHLERRRVRLAVARPRLASTRTGSTCCTPRYAGGRRPP